ncbi:hypothetical protein Ciccas_005391 [Cichlidogyrus casuarinus]|uniref:phenylalanine--tRNA ligase n=1 Tax=Cichlidogyrus casuarinus TaxID=1844966 RepID=A0ABD2Q8V3_9PLAT
MDIQDKILHELSSNEPLSSIKLAQKLNTDHLVVIGALKSLDSHQNLIKLEQRQEAEFQLSAEGEHILQHGSHEYVIFNAIPAEGKVPSDSLNSISQYSKVGLSKALAAKWITLEKTDTGPLVSRKVSSVEDEVQKALIKIHQMNLNDVPKNTVIDLKKRKLISEGKITWYLVSRGENFTTKIEKPELDLTQEMLANGTWSSKQFKEYNFHAKGVVPEGGHLHPLLRVRAEFARILTEMGFQEMPTNQFVENSFWNFDALFQPQQHPARDAHDTFFVADPARSNVVAHCPSEYIEAVRSVHESGGYGSMGYQTSWSMEEAEKNILRTHTTAVSSRMLYKLAHSVKHEIKPVKYFSIDRVFRNETLDATHLAEFHQVEGVVADFGIGLKHLKAVIRAFFERLGLSKLRFKPAYNPYTEPSMEIFAFHDGLHKWVEIGNSGVFRPEMLRPMGLPPNMNVIAWGLSLERPTMIRYGYKNIRDLIGPKVDLSMIFNSPICRIEKN